jgi:hypothetical protein
MAGYVRLSAHSDCLTKKRCHVLLTGYIRNSLSLLSPEHISILTLNGGLIWAERIL